ncbi:MAG: hypothetical protein U5O39_03435 [Gammaproteobacteria bacterium]|nr:hypothetical protein [Gammaproteobacteria bacterium]
MSDPQLIWPVMTTKRKKFVVISERSGLIVRRGVPGPIDKIVRDIFFYGALSPAEALLDESPDVVVCPLVAVFNLMYRSVNLVHSLFLGSALLFRGAVASFLHCPGSLPMYDPTIARAS